MKSPKVLFVGPSRKTFGGVATVINQYKQMPFWAEFRCGLIETQTNTDFSKKIWCAISSYIEAIFIVPFYNILHFHTTPGRSMLVQFPIFLLAKLWHKKIVIHLHVGDQLCEKQEDKFSIWVLNHSNHVIVLADCLRKYIVKQYKLKCPVSYLYNPVSIIEEQGSHAGCYFLFCAYFAENKGYMTILEAFEKVSALFPDYKLVMAGTGSILDINRIKSFISTHGLQEKVILPGWISPLQIKALISNSTAVCLASRHEGFPMVVLESWAAGTPVVSTLVGGLKDVAIDGKNILLFKFAESDQLAEKMIRIICDQSLRNELSTSGRDLCRSMFSVDSVEQSLRKLYYGL